MTKNKNLMNMKDYPPEKNMNKSKDEALKTMNKISMFVKEHIIPIAIQNNAIIITSGYNGCSLTNAIGREALDIKLQYGGVLPFSLIGILNENSVW